MPDQYERILAVDIAPGDYVARSRNETFTQISDVAHHNTAVSLYAGGRGKFARPRKTAKWWRKVVR